MPFVSKAQVRKFGALVQRGEMSQRTFDEWLKATPSIKRLPERVGAKKKKSRAKTRKRRKPKVKVQKKRRKR